MLKKLLALGLSLTLALSLAACGGDPAEAEDKSTESPASSAAEDAQSAQEKTGDGERFVFWDKSEYVKGYNDMMQAKVEDFTEKTGIEVEYVIIPSNDQKQKLMAAIEAGNPPDLFMSDDMLCAQFVEMDQIADVSDVVQTMDLTDAADNISKLKEETMLVPLAMLAPGCYWRRDLWEDAGLDQPTTWEELRDDARIVNDPANGVYALGFPMGASGGGDAEGFMRSLILSYGGVPVDENGKVTINSPETLEALEYVASLFEEGLVPPDAITWDDGGNNSAYLAGTVGVVFNSGSIWSAMQEENEELLDKTEIIPYPAGPTGDYYVPGGANTFAVFKEGENPDAAKEFVKYFFEDQDNYNSMIEAMGGMWQPILNGMDDTEFWKEDVNAGWLANADKIVRNFHPAPADEKANLTFSNQLCVKAVQEIVVNGTDPQEALDHLETEFVSVYGE